MGVNAWRWVKASDDLELPEFIRRTNDRMGRLATTLNTIIADLDGVDAIRSGATTPSVQGAKTLVVSNPAPLTITAFKDGQPGDERVLWSTTANTTIAHSAAVGGIFMLGGANVTMGANEVRRFLTLDGVSWREVQSGSALSGVSLRVSGTASIVGVATFGGITNTGGALVGIGDINLPAAGTDEFGRGLTVKVNDGANYAASITNYSAAGKGMRVYANGGAAGRTLLSVESGAGVAFVIDGLRAASFGSTLDVGGLLTRTHAAATEGWIADITTGLNNTVMGCNDTAITSVTSGALAHHSFFGSLNNYPVDIITNGARQATFGLAGITFAAGLTITAGGIAVTGGSSVAGNLTITAGQLVSTTVGTNSGGVDLILANGGTTIATLSVTSARTTLVGGLTVTGLGAGGGAFSVGAANSGGAGFRQVLVPN